MVDKLLEMDCRARVMTAAHEAGDCTSQLLAAMPTPGPDASAPTTLPPVSGRVAEDPVMIFFDFAGVP